MAVNGEGLLAVTDDTNRSVHLLSKDGVLKRSIGSEVLSDDLSGVAFDLKGNVLVADRKSHNVVKLSQEGHPTQSIDHAGSGQLKEPYGVCVSQSGQIYICDIENHHIAVYDEEGKFLLIFGSEGSDPECFDGPGDIAFGSDGLVYITDEGNERVCVWSEEGTFKRNFPTMYVPRYIAATSDDHLVITSFQSHTVMVYTLEGELVHELKEGDWFHGPMGICVDDDGLVYVADHGNQRIQVF